MGALHFSPLKGVSASNKSQAEGLYSSKSLLQNVQNRLLTRAAQNRSWVFATLAGHERVFHKLLN